MSDPSPSSERGRGEFPTTRWTIIREAQDPSSPAYRQSLEHLASLYWRAIYGYFRRKWGKSHEEARDLTQDFFTAMCEKDFLQNLSPEHGRFRSYVMAALDNFVRLEYRARMTQKRGGGAIHLTLDLSEEFQPASGATPEDAFLRDWARSVLAEALEELRRECREAGQEKTFQIFSFRDLDSSQGTPPSYDEVARRFSVAVTDVTNALYRARKRLRELVLMRVRDTVTSDVEAESEMRELFEKRLPM